MFWCPRRFIRPSLFATAGLSAVLLLFPAWARAGSPPQSFNPPNVILITIDTLRADHLGCYGDRTAATPNIDALARTGVRFTHAYTPVPLTLPAHACLLTGTYPMDTGMHDFTTNKLPASAVSLAKVLHQNGYSTAAFIGAAVTDGDHRSPLQRGGWEDSRAAIADRRYSESRHEAGNPYSQGDS